jgi:hypothetical protein
MVLDRGLEERLRAELPEFEMEMAVANTLNWWREQFKAIHGRDPTPAEEEKTTATLYEVAEATQG